MSARRDVAARDLPDWLRPVAESVEQVTASALSPRMPEPPDDARRSSVLMLFGEGSEGPDVLLTERAHTMRSHAGQIAFPGGSADPEDVDLVDTALREAYEEVGVEATGVDVFGRLPSLWLPPSNFSVTTILGWWREPHDVAAVDPAEVESVFRTPIEHLLDPANRVTVRNPMGWEGPGFFVADGLTLWGFTAGVIARLFEHVGWERPWDTRRVVPSPKSPPTGDIPDPGTP